ncbi:hypothetical protein CDL12_25106 [Handroanthus impetiginosus]|uniref:Uncharacterized protein n=1 Tax=Handroanthus impetiginosus TaxID=429701 RepID=A0A2G9GAR5_9LAMI|nr:hypothetical protein CDL12_25106 [Handroanthus impetiginosus]
MVWSERIRMKSKLKWLALGGLVLSFASILVHLFLAKSSASFVQYGVVTAFTEDLNLIDNPSRKGPGYRRLWGKVNVLEPLQPYANPRSRPYPGNVSELPLLELQLYLMVVSSALIRNETC